MPFHLQPDIPLVVVGNVPEAAYSFLALAGDDTEKLVQVRLLKGERSLLWAGESKLVVLSFHPRHMTYLRERLGYKGTECIAPNRPTAHLSRDILREPELMGRLVDYAGPGRTLQMIPYVTTRPFLKLVDFLRNEYNLTMLLPESPSPENLWVRDYMGTKSGFRTLAGSWLPQDELPEGIICQNVGVAADVVSWFHANGRDCIVKPDQGQAGIGIHLFAGEQSSKEESLKRLQQDPFLQSGLITVEEFIHSSRMISPSLEFCVPPLGVRDPHVTYLSNQLLIGTGQFCGVLASRELEQATWYPRFRENGLLIAKRLQKMGYIGHFDLDAIVNDEERLYPVEINARRTGGTHVHEFACFAFGPDYLDNVVLLSQDAMSSGSITDSQVLLELIEDLLYPISGGRWGVVITMTSTLATGKFGCIFVAPNTEEALGLHETVTQRIQDAAVAD